MINTAWIDFWTTNTSIWYSSKEWEGRVIELYNWNTIDRTSVFYSFEDGWLPIVWEKWFEEKLLWELWRLITSPKKFLKSEKLPAIQILREKYDLVDIISHIISHFKEKLEEEVWREVPSILVGRPVRFHDTDDKLNELAEARLKDAFKKAWFKNIEFQFEPIAAFNAYVNEHKELKNTKNKVLVVDLWWWTSDFSLFDVNDNWLNIIWNTWVYVWWDNLDQSLIKSHFSKFLWKWAGYRLMSWNISEIPTHFFHDFSDKSKLIFFHEHEELIKWLMTSVISKEDNIALWRFNDIFKNISVGYLFHSCVEKSKIWLTNSEDVNINFDMFNDNFSTILSRQKFNELINEDVNKIKQALDEILNISWVKADDVDKIIMNWWTSYIPLIQTMVEDVIWKWKILKGNNLSSVWYWLTIESYEKFR